MIVGEVTKIAFNKCPACTILVLLACTQNPTLKCPCTLSSESIYLNFHPHPNLVIFSRHFPLTSNFLPSTHLSVCPQSTFERIFSAAEVVSSVNSCTVIGLGMPFKHTLLTGDLDHQLPPK